jgi:integrase
MASEKLHFTRKSLEALAAPVKRQIVHDTETRALVLEISPTGTKTFRLYRKVEGRPEKITLGRFNPNLPDSREFTQGTDLLKVLLTKPELNVKMARRLAEAVNVQLDSGRNVAETKREARGELTLGQMFERYMTEHVEAKGVRTGQAIRELYERFLGELPDHPVKKHGVKRTKAPFGVNWHNRKLSSIRPEEVRKVHTAAGQVLAGSTANKIVDLLNVLYNKAKAWGEFAGTPPTIGIELFSEATRARFLKAHEIPAFFAALEAEPSQDFADLTVLLLLAGARVGNTIAMRWADLDLKAAEWTVPGEVSKNGNAMVIVLVPEAIEVLKRRHDEREQGCEWVFPADSASGHMSYPRKRWVALLERAGIKDLRIHDLRRSLGSWQARTGSSLQIIGRSLGHKSLQATKIYSQLDMDPVRESVTRATDALLAAGRAEPSEVIPLPTARKQA